MQDLRGSMFRVYPKADCDFAELTEKVCQEFREALARDPEVLKEKSSEADDLDRTASLRTEVGHISKCCIMRQALSKSTDPRPADDTDVV